MRKGLLVSITIGVLAFALAFSVKVVRSEEPTTTSQVETTTAKKKKTLPKSVTSFMKKNVYIKKATLLSKKKIQLEWKKTKGADGYGLYKKTGKGKIKGIKTITKGSTVTFTDKKAKYGKTYRYYIRAFKKYKNKKYLTKNNSGRLKVFKVKKKKKGKYHYFYDMDGKKIKNTSAFLTHPRYSLRVNVVKSTMTVFAKDGTKGYSIPVHVYLIAGNVYDTAGTYKLGAKYRFRGLYYNSHSQWSARIYEDILFHTTLYKRSQDPNSLDTKTYNKLGTPSSHGCIRLQCVAAKFIYDKCPVGTRVVITKSKNPGPLGKPKLEKIKKWHTWDPTDPIMKWKCKKYHCKHKKY